MKPFNSDLHKRPQDIPKPVFLSKAERERLAAESKSQSAPPKPPSQNLFSSSTKRKATEEVEKPSEEVVELKSKYLGIGTNAEKKARKMLDRKKFVFDWDESEDTSTAQPLPITLPNRARLGGMGDKLISVSKKPELHWSEKPLEEMTQRDWRIFREDYSITVRGTNVPPPLRSWSESTIPKSILKVIDTIGYKKPTPIQRQAIPIAMSGRDIIGVAETGSGKTASFVIPMLSFIKDLKLDMSNSHLGPFGVVLAPTRELAIQIEEETAKFAKPMGLGCISIVGGHSIESQTNKLIEGVHVVIATPGRLRDLIDRRLLALAQCIYVVMDEADRMVDLGFEADLKFILSSMPVSNLKPEENAEDLDWLKDKLDKKQLFRQTVMFSATMPPSVEKLAKEYLRRPVNVTVGQVGQVVDRIEQRVEMISGETKKLARIERILNSGEFEKPIMIFANQKKTCDNISWALSKKGYRCSVLHGGKSQDNRESSLGGLKSGLTDVLVATDVAGRGIDVKDVSLVINYDMAKNIEMYTHRIGRTGRAGKKGCAITFLCNDDAEVFYDLKVLLQKSPLSTIPQELLRHEAAQQKPTLKR